MHSEWPWWDDLHAFWWELLNYNPQGVQSSKPGALHAAGVVVLFAAPAHVDEDSQQSDSGGEQSHASICGLEGRGMSQLADDMDNADTEGVIAVSSADLHGTEHN